MIVIWYNHQLKPPQSTNMLVQSTLFLFNFLIKMTNFEDLVFALTEANNGNELLQAIDEYLAQQSA